MQLMALTLVHAWVLASKQTGFGGRKTMITQNVMCACDLDMIFTFVFVGWEVTGNDACVFLYALTRLEVHFVKWVQPKCFRRPKLYFFYLSPLGLQHTVLFKNKSEEPAAFFFLESRKGGCWVFSPGAEIRGAVVVFFCSRRETVLFLCSVVLVQEK